MGSESDIRCPECGRSANDISLPNPVGLLHWRSTVPAAIALLLLAAIAWFAIVNVLTLRAGPGSFSSILVDPARTRADVERIASGAVETHGALADSILGIVPAQFRESWPGDSFVRASFVKQSNERSTSAGLGWPTNWYSRYERSYYANALTRAGFVPLQTNARGELVDANAWAGGNNPVPRKPRWSFNRNAKYSLAYRPPVEETGGVEVWVDVSLFAIASSLGLIAFAWISTAVIVWIANAIFFRKRPRVGRVAKWFAATIMFVSILILAWDSASHSERVRHDDHGDQKKTPAGGWYIAKSGVGNTGISVRDLKSLPNRASSDQKLAQAILDAAPASNASDYLAVDVASEVAQFNSTIKTYGDTLFLATYSEDQYQRIPEFGDPILLTLPRSTSLTITANHLSYQIATGNPNLPVRRWTLNIEAVGGIAFAVWLGWALSALVTRMIAKLIARRRRKHGRCIACNYVLTAPVAS